MIYEAIWNDVLTIIIIIIIIIISYFPFVKKGDNI